MFPPSPHSLKKHPSLEFGVKPKPQAPLVNPVAISWWLRREPYRVQFFFDVRKSLKHIKMPSRHKCDFAQAATSTPVTSMTILYREHRTVDTITSKKAVTIDQVLKRISK